MSGKMAGQPGLRGFERYFLQDAYSINQRKSYLERFDVAFDNVHPLVVFPTHVIL